MLLEDEVAELGDGRRHHVCREKHVHDCHITDVQRVLEAHVANQLVQLSSDGQLECRHDPKYGHCNIKNIQKGKGTLKIGLFNNEEDWLQRGKAVRSFQKTIDPSHDSMKIVVKDIEDGFYGLAVHHDINDNDKMDIQMFPPGPAEGYAFSVIDKIGLSAPSWNDCKYSLNDSSDVDLVLVYP